MRWWANLIKVLLILPSLLKGGRDGFSTLIFPWCRLPFIILFAASGTSQVSFSSHAFADCLAMSCGMTSKTSKSFSSWPAVYRWRWRNEDLTWQCVADIDRHWFRRHSRHKACSSSQLRFLCLYLSVAAVHFWSFCVWWQDMWASLSMVKLHDTDAACTRHEFVRDLSDFKVSKHSRIFGAMALFLTRRVFSSFLSFFQSIYAQPLLC